MRPTSLHVRGINSLHDLEVDLEQVPPGLCAVVGENGVGKSTLLECMLPVPFYLAMPTRPGSLVDSCTARDTMVDFRHVHRGSTYRHLITVDAGLSRPRPEAYLYVDGVAKNDGKLGTYEEAILQLLPPKSLVLASAFATQNGNGSFAQLDKHGRRKLFRTMLGLGPMQALSDRAGHHRKPLDAMSGDLDRKAEALDADRTKRNRLRSEIEIAEAARAPLQERVGELRGELLERQTAQAQADAVLRTADEVRTKALERWARLQRTIDAAGSRRRVAEGDLGRAQALLDQGEQIEEDVRAIETARAKRAECATKYADADQKLKASWTATNERSASITRLQEDLGHAARDLRAAERAEEQLDHLRHRATQYAEARTSRPDVAERSRQASQDHQEADGAATAKQRAAVRRVDQARAELTRARRDADTLADVPCGGQRALVFGSTEDEEMGDGTRVDCGTCSVLASATAARDRLPGLEAELPEAEAEAKAARDEVHRVSGLQADARDARAALRALDGSISDLAGADMALTNAEEALRRRDEANSRRASVQDEIGKLKKAQEEGVSEQARLERMRNAAEVAGREQRATMTRLEGTATRLAELQRARGQAPLLQRTIEEQAQAEQLASEQLDAEEVPAETEELLRTAQSARTAVTRCSEDLDAATSDVSEAMSRVARLEGQSQALGDMDERATLLAEDRERVARRRSGLVLLERGFGPEGIQALDIDAAGPGVSAIVNELLGCMGAHYTVQLRTVREATARRKQAEVFDILVHDSRSCTSRELGRMSGGEQVLIEESIKLAIAVRVAQHTGRSLGTIWRDECDDGLSVGNAARYPTMLREALRRGDFERCYFITHRPAVAAQADSVLLLADGGATLLDPGAYAERHHA